MGIGVFLKSFAPLTLYLGGLGCALLAMGGNVRWALMLVTFLLPLRNVIEKIQQFPVGNQFIDILLIGIIIGSLFHKEPSNSKNSPGSSIHAIAIITIIWLLMSLFRGDLFLYGGLHFDIHDSRVQDWKNYSLMPLLFFLHFKNNITKKDVWSIFAVMCFSIFVADYYTVNQISEYSSLVSRSKISGTFQFLGPNEVAAFFNEYTIILMSVLYAIKKGRNKWLLLILILANLYCITFLYSRGAYAALMVGMLILFSFKDKKLLIPLFLVLILWQSVLPQSVIDRIKETKSQTGQLDESSQHRLDIWQQAFEYIKSNPLVGIGFGSFRHLGLELGDTHNIYVKIMTEQGLVGIIVFLIAVFCFMKEGWQLYQKGDDDLSKALGLGFVCCVFVMMINNFFGDRWSYLEPNVYLWIFAGLVAKLNVICHQTSQDKPLEKNTSKPTDLTAQEEPVKPIKPKKKLRYYDPQ